MPKFTYTGEDGEGKKVTKTVEADDRYAVYDIARRDGHRISSIEEEKHGGLGKFLNMDRINVMLSRVKADELVMITRNLGSMLTAGLTVTRAISVIERLTKKIKGAMIYPAIVVTVMVIIGVLMMIYVMPQITGVFKGMDMDLPATTQFLIATSDFFAAHTLLTSAIMIGSVIGVMYFLKSKVGRVATSWVIPRLPVIGTMAKETNSARTARTLSSLLNSGVDVIQAIEITEEVVQNVFYKKILRDARMRVEKGTALSEVFIERTDLYPILVGEMILVGEETGQISGMLNELAIFYETEVERKTKDLSTIIEPLLMVAIGAGVGFFALAMIAPIYSISDGLK